MSNFAYLYPYVDVITVMEDIEEYIIPENREACKLLWSKNIFTSMTNNYDNNYSWINIRGLSKENEDLLWERARTDKRFGLVGNGIGIAVYIKPGVGNDTFEAFKELIDLFQYQDVTREYYMTEEEFMINCTDCSIVIRNPEYNPLPRPKKSDYKTPLEYSLAYTLYADSVSVPSRIRTVDQSKVTKSYAEYIRESKYKNSYDEEEGKVFLNEYFYKAHMRYKEMKKGTKVR